MAKKNGNGWRKIGVIFTIIMTLAGVLWAAAQQSSKVDDAHKIAVKAYEKADANEEKIIRYEVKMDALIKSHEDLSDLIKSKHGP